MMLNVYQLIIKQQQMVCIKLQSQFIIRLRCCKACDYHVWKYFKLAKQTFARKNTSYATIITDNACNISCKRQSHNTFYMWIQPPKQHVS